MHPEPNKIYLPQFLRHRRLDLDVFVRYYTSAHSDVPLSRGVHKQLHILVLFENDRQPRHPRIGCIGVKILWVLLMVLGVADAGKRSAIRHEFLVESKPAKDGLDQ